MRIIPMPNHLPHKRMRRREIIVKSNRELIWGFLVSRGFGKLPG